MLVRDAEHSYLTLENADEEPLDQLRGHSMMCMDARMPRVQDASIRPTPHWLVTTPKYDVFALECAIVDGKFQDWQKNRIRQYE